ncbi:MAG: class II glutamine amidotransferase [Reyranellaceae bacterium]
MCELFGLASRWPTRATFSLQGFAAHGGLGQRSVDGWGLAAADGRDFRLYREPEPAGESAWLEFIRQHGVASSLIVSHIRHATRGQVTLANTQPFLRELGGRAHVFAHNGRLDMIDDLFDAAAPRFRPIGDTDSEMAFCLLLESLVPLWQRPSAPGLPERRAVVDRFAAGMRTLGPANFLYSDGEYLFAHGHRRSQADGTIAPPGLWKLHRDCRVDGDALSPAGVHLSTPAGEQVLTLFASVPLSGEAWRPLAEGETVVVAAGQGVPAGAAAVEEDEADIGRLSSRSQT